MIIIVSADEDVHAQAVMSELNTMQVDARILDMREFPMNSTLSLEPGTPGAKTSRREWVYRDKTINLEDVNVVWWRRPQAYETDPAITDPNAANFVFHECEEAVQGMWLTLDAFWINPPLQDERAARKVWQLDIARDCGLKTPRTLVTNNPEHARAFIQVDGIERTIYKPFQGSETTWRETRLLKSEELEKLDAVSFAPLIFQEYVEAETDIRVTVVGDKMFPAAIHSQQSAYKVDFRMDMNGTKIEPHSLPAKVEKGLRKLMNKMGLVYGAIDLRRTPEGDYVFLEINPAGQWLFVEDGTSQPISKAMAELMRVENEKRKPVRESSTPAYAPHVQHNGANQTAVQVAMTS